MIIDLDFKPSTYFVPRALEEFLVTKVKSDILRQKLITLVENGKREEFENLLKSITDFPEIQSGLEAIHPQFMGGNYLANLEPGEVEIARISINSTTLAVNCVYAKMHLGKICLRVVDEYGGETLNEPSELTVEEPLTLGDVTNFFLNACELEGTLEANFGNDLESSLDFFTASSDFYPNLDKLVREIVEQYFLTIESIETE